MYVQEFFFKFKLLRELSFRFLAENFALHFARIPSKVNLRIVLTMGIKVWFKLRFNIFLFEDLFV